MANNTAFVKTPSSLMQKGIAKPCVIQLSHVWIMPVIDGLKFLLDTQIIFLLIIKSEEIKPLLMVWPVHVLTMSKSLLYVKHSVSINAEKCLLLSGYYWSTQDHIHCHCKIKWHPGEKSASSDSLPWKNLMSVHMGCLTGTGRTQMRIISKQKPLKNRNN